MDAMRLDKWLWAARFYKTRSLAQTACDGGKVDVNGQAAKPARAIRPGDRIQLTLGEWRREAVVKLLTERRGPAAQT
jgi:ribosome-associated heat shock protein Hsp15